MTGRTPRKMPSFPRVTIADTRNFIDKYLVGLDPVAALKSVGGTVGAAYAIIVASKWPQWTVYPVLSLVTIVAIINFLNIPKTPKALAADPNILNAQAEESVQAERGTPHD